MKYLARLAPAFVLALLAVPSFASAQTTISSGPGGFSYSSPGFSIGWGTGAGGGMFACGASNICQVASTILFIINSVLVPVLFAFAFIVFLWGVFKKYIWSRGDEKAIEEGHRLIWWGIIGFVIMISLWGLVNVVANTFGLAGVVAPRTPTSY